MNKVSLDHLNLTVRNFDETVKWYKEIFGFELVEKGYDSGRPWGVIRHEDSMLCIYESPDRIELPWDSKKYHRIYHFGLRLDDRAMWEGLLKTRFLTTYYGSPVKQPFSIAWYIKDPNGYMIEVLFWDEDKVTFPPFKDMDS